MKSKHKQTRKHSHKSRKNNGGMKMTGENKITHLNFMYPQSKKAQQEWEKKQKKFAKTKQGKGKYLSFAESLKMK